MPLTELLNPAVLMAAAIAIAFPIVVVIGVFVLRRVIARRNPELSIVAADAEPGAVPAQTPAARPNHEAGLA